MSTKLDEAKQKLQFVSRALSNSYLDYDTLDELGVAISTATRLITEHQEAQKCIEVGNANVYRVTVYEPASA